MIKDKFLKLGGRIINTDHVIQVRSFEGGVVRIFSTMINDSKPGAPAYWEYQGDEAEKVLAFFNANSTSLF